MLVNARNQMLFLEMIKEDKTTEARAISVNGNFVELTRKLKQGRTTHFPRQLMPALAVIQNQMWVENKLLITNTKTWTKMWKRKQYYWRSMPKQTIFNKKYFNVQIDDINW